MTIITTNQLSSLQLTPLNPNLIIVPGVICTSNASTIYNLFNGNYTDNTQVSVFGTVAAEFTNAISLLANFAAGTGNHRLVIGDTAVVASNMDYAAVWVRGEHSHITNAGEIYGGTAIYCESWLDGTVTNTGAAMGGLYTGMHLISSINTDITNSGIISGTIGIKLESSSATILNSGTITSTNATAAAIDASFGTSNLTLTNTGDITAAATAVIGSTAADRVVNRGTITGDVVLGDGNDVYRGRKGDLSGNVSGGQGNDTLIGGADDDVLDGGFSNDRLEGSEGQDTLTGGGGRDVFVFRPGDGNDTVQDFVNGTDKLDLSAYHLTGFAALSLAAIDTTGGMLLDLGPAGGDVIFLAGFLKANFDATDVIL